MKTPSPSFLPPFFSGMASAVLLLILVLAGCAVAPAPDMDNSALDEYQAELDRLAKQPKPSRETAERGVADWKALLADLSVEHLEGKASKVFADDAFLNDTLKTLRSSEKIEDYLVETARMLENGTVEYRDTARADDGGFYVRWEMVYSGKKLSGGKPIRTIGMSHVVIDADGRVALQQDFWDSTRGIFQHIPVVGGQIRFIKNRL